jgi:hypothetical protein
LIEDWYDSRVAWLDRAAENAENTRQKARLKELKQAGHYQVYPGFILDHYKSFISCVAIAVVLSVVLTLSPIFIKDRLRPLLDLQYTTKKGRNLYKTKAAAGLISAFVVIVSVLIVYFGIYVGNINQNVLRGSNLSVFFQVPIHTFTGAYHWFDPTFLQYIVLTVMAVCVLGLVFALLAISFSSVMSNYVSLIGIQIPPVFAVLFFGLSYLVGDMIDIRVAQWAAPASYSLAVVASAAFLILMWRREKQRDIVL